MSTRILLPQSLAEAQADLCRLYLQHLIDNSTPQAIDALRAAAHSGTVKGAISMVRGLHERRLCDMDHEAAHTFGRFGMHAPCTAWGMAVACALHYGADKVAEIAADTRLTAENVEPEPNPLTDDEQAAWQLMLPDTQWAMNPTTRVRSRQYRGWYLQVRPMPQPADGWQWEATARRPGRKGPDFTAGASSESLAKDKCTRWAHRTHLHDDTDWIEYDGVWHRQCNGYQLCVARNNDPAARLPWVGLAYGHPDSKRFRKTITAAKRHATRWAQRQQGRK